MKPVENNGFCLETGGPEAPGFRTPPGPDFMRVPPEYGPDAVCGTARDSRWVFFRAGPGPSLKTTVVADTDEVTALFHGSLYETVDASALRDRMLGMQSLSQAESLARELSGIFCGIVYRKKERRLLGWTDPYGVEKLFYRRDGAGRMRWATHPFLCFRRGEKPALSDFAFGSILYCGHLFSGTVFREVSAVNAGCCVRGGLDGISESEYVAFPETVSRRDSGPMLDAAHRDYWRRMAPRLDGQCALLLSRGKDSRILLKYMLDAGLRPRIVSFYRKDNPLYPFACLLQESVEDNEAARRLSSRLGLSCESLRIPNHYLLDRLDPLVELNSGPPLHWEFLAAAERTEDGHPFLLSGFEGDILAGLHETGGVPPGARAARRMFHRLGDRDLYRGLSGALAQAGFPRLPDLAELEERWQGQYRICGSSRPELWMQWGFIRTRGAGRSVPTFHQMRRFSQPVYPYLDRTVMAAYHRLGRRDLRWKRAHLGLLAEDERFRDLPVTRLKLSARQEYRMLGLIGVLRRLDRIRQLARQSRAEPSAPREEALSRTLQDLGFDSALWRSLDRRPRTDRFYVSITRLIAAVRIRDALDRLTGPAVAEPGCVPTEFAPANEDP